MKNKTTLILTFLFIALMSFTSKNINEATYSSKYITYSVERSGSTAVLTVDVVDLLDYDEIYLKRSTNPTEDFRQVKYLTKSQIPTLGHTGTIIDKYPLPGNMDAYYKVVALNKEGIYKLFPCVKLSKYQ